MTPSPKLHEKLLYEFQRGVDPDSQRSLRDRFEPKKKLSNEVYCGERRTLSMYTPKSNGSSSGSIMDEMDDEETVLNRLPFDWNDIG